MAPIKKLHVAIQEYKIICIKGKPPWSNKPCLYGINILLIFQNVNAYIDNFRNFEFSLFFDSRLNENQQFLFILFFLLSFY